MDHTVISVSPAFMVVHSMEPHVSVRNIFFYYVINVIIISNRYKRERHFNDICALLLQLAPAIIKVLYARVRRVNVIAQLKVLSAIIANVVTYLVSITEILRLIKDPVFVS